MYDKQISEGIALLDTDRPGWADLIDVTVLNVADPDACVLHQVYGDYDTASRDLDLDESEVVACGFALPDDAWSSREYDQLTREWITAIQARKAGAS